MSDTHDTLETVYRPEPDILRPGLLLRSIFHDMVSSRELSWRLFIRNLRSMYRQTLLGLFWAFLPPLANTAIWIFLRNQGVFQFEGLGGVSAAPFILAGMILWQAFVDSFQMPLNTINANRAMVSKLNFPREALLVEGIADVLFNLGIRLLLLIPAFLLFGVSPHWSWLWAPPLILLLILLGAGLGMLIFPLGSLYQDVGKFIALAIPFWMILTPIIYMAPRNAGGSLLTWLNPAAPLLTGARDLLLFGSALHFWPTMAYAVLAVPLFVLGLLVFRISMPILVERMAN